jgi:hypothetical protein
VDSLWAADSLGGGNVDHEFEKFSVHNVDLQQAQPSSENKE